MDEPLGNDPDGNSPLEEEGKSISKVRIPIPPEQAWFEDEIMQLVQGDAYLVSGAGGSGKSILLSQLGIGFARNEKIAVVLTEESEAAHRARIMMMLSECDGAEVAAVQNNILVEDGVPSEMLAEFVATHVLRPGGGFHGVRLLFIDSLMGAGVPSTPGPRWTRIFKAIDLCKKAGVTTFASAHVVKSGAMAGPSALRHNCDVHLDMRQLGNHRLLYVTKNRNGRTDRCQPARLVIDPVTVMLKPAPHAEPLAVCARTYVAGVGEIEIQSTIGLTLGNRRRIVSGSIPHGEIDQLMDMISDIRGVDVNDTDFAISVRMPGARTYAPTMGLALSMSLVGSALQEQIPEHLLFIGEIDLLRRVRDVPDLMATALKRDDIAAWAASRDIALVRAGEAGADP